MTLYECGGSNVCVFVEVEQLEKISPTFLLIQVWSCTLSDSMGFHNVLAG